MCFFYWRGVRLDLGKKKCRDNSCTVIICLYYHFVLGLFLFDFCVVFFRSPFLLLIYLSIFFWCFLFFYMHVFLFFFLYSSVLRLFVFFVIIYFCDSFLLDSVSWSFIPSDSIRLTPLFCTVLNLFFLPFFSPFLPFLSSLLPFFPPFLSLFFWLWLWLWLDMLCNYSYY